MPFILYDFVNEAHVNEFKKWTQDLEKNPRAKLNEKIDKLFLYGDGLHPHVLTDTDVPGIQKLRVQGNVKLRPLLCKGPVQVHAEYTFLMGAKEIGSKWVPANAPKKANDKKQAVRANPKTRRIEHEKIY